MRRFGAVRLWSFALTGQASDAAWQMLSDDELVRAARFRFLQPRMQFVEARAALRRILGQRCHVPPEAIQFAYGPQGKPTLAWPDCDVQFNISHTTGWAVCALAPRPVGVDIERLRAVDAAALTKRICSKEEATAILSLPEPQRTRAFFVAWTRKEAYVKALGVGFSHPLKQVAVTAPPGSGQMWDFTPEDGYVAALVLLD